MEKLIQSMCFRKVKLKTYLANMKLTKYKPTILMWFIPTSKFTSMIQLGL